LAQDMTGKSRDEAQ